MRRTMFVLGAVLLGLFVFFAPLGARVSPAYADAHDDVFVYAVQPGDTLSQIAQRFLGDARRYPELAAYNGIKNPNLIHAGQTIRIPGAVAQTETLQIASSVVAYTVRPGDTLSHIAFWFYGDAHRYPELSAYNNIENPNLIYAGQRLLIPNPVIIPTFTQTTMTDRTPPVVTCDAECMIARQDERINTLANENEALRNEIATLQTEITALETAHENLAAEQAALRAELEALRDQIAASDHQGATTEGRGGMDRLLWVLGLPLIAVIFLATLLFLHTQKMNNENRSVKQQFDDTTQKHSETQMALEAAKESNETLTVERAEHLQAITKLEERVKQKNARIRDLTHATEPIADSSPAATAASPTPTPVSESSVIPAAATSPDQLALQLSSEELLALLKTTKPCPWCDESIEVKNFSRHVEERCSKRPHTAIS